jgi:PAP2 superfamily protein
MRLAITRTRVITVVAMFLFVGGTVGAVAGWGLDISRDVSFIWAMIGLLALSLTDLRRWAKGLFVDWLPFIGFLFAYDLARGAADNLGIAAHTSAGIDFDKALFFGQVPSSWLQNHLYNPFTVHWYDYIAFGVYMTHFFATLVVAALLWRFAYPQFRRFRAMVLTLAGAGFLTYALFPATPPWLAAQDGQLPPIHRVVGEVWGHVGVVSAQTLFQSGSEYVNDVAAVPSLHAAFPVLIMLFFWGMARGWQRVVLAAYPLAMGFTLVYGGEHYVLDVVLGWAYAVAVYALVTGIELVRGREPGASALELSSSRVQA